MDAIAGPVRTQLTKRQLARLKAKAALSEPQTSVAALITDAVLKAYPEIARNGNGDKKK